MLWSQVTVRLGGKVGLWLSGIYEVSRPVAVCSVHILEILREWHEAVKSPGKQKEPRLCV